MKIQDIDTQYQYRLYEQLSDGFLICDAKQKAYPITYASDGFCAFTQYNREDIIGESCQFLQGKGTDPVTVQAIRDALCHKRSFRGRIVNYRKDGSSFWNLLRIEPIFDDQGEVIQYLGSQTDLTGIADQELEELHMLRQVVEQAPIFIDCVQFNGADPVVRFQNQKARELTEDENLNRQQSPRENYSSSGFAKTMKKGKEVLRNNTKAIFDIDFITADQQTLKMKQMLFPVSDVLSQSQPLLATIMVDVSEESQLLQQLQSVKIELQHSHDILSSLGDTDKIGVFQADATGFIIGVDEVCERLVNKKEGDLLGDAWMSALHPEDKAPMVENWTRFVSSSSAVHSDTYRVMIQNNESLVLKTHASKQYNDMGQVEGITGFVVDLTAEMKNSDNSIMYQLLWEHIHSLLPIGVYEMNKDGSLASCNAYMEMITGVPESEAVTHGWQQSVHPDDMHRIVAAWTDFYTGDCKQPYIEELRLVVEGEVRYIRTICIAVYQDDKVNGFIGCMWHRTEEEKNQRLLKQQEKRIQQTESLAGTAYWECDLSGALTYYDWQGAELFGASDLKQLLGMNWLQAIAEKDRHRVENHWADFVSHATEKEVFEEQYHIATLDSQACLKVVGKGVFKKGKIRAFSAVIMDVTNDCVVSQKLEYLVLRYQELQRVTQAGSWEWDIEQNTVWWSKETYRIFELDPRQISASYENYMRCLTDESRQLVQSQVEKILVDGADYEHLIYIKSNPDKVLRGNGYLTKNADGNPVKISGTIQDITQQVEKETKTLQDTRRAQEVTDEIARALNDIAQGNLDSSFSPKHKYHPILIACKQLRETLKKFSSEVMRVAKEVGYEGKLGGQANVNNVSGVWAELTENVNTMADNLTTQVREINQYAEYLADGVLDYTPDLKSPGEIKLLVDNLARVQSNIRNVLSTAEKISAGDYTSEVTPVSEYDALGHAVNSMTKSLKAKTETLSQNAKLLDEFLLNARDVFIRLDPEFNVLYLSHSFYKLTGDEIAPLIGLPISLLSKDLSKRNMADVFKAEWLSSSSTIKLAEKTLRFKVKLKNSELILEAVYWPIRNIEGEAKEYHLLARNITEQVSVEARNELLHNALNNMEPIFSVVKYPSKEVVWMNQNHLGVDVNEVSSRKYCINEFHSSNQFDYFERCILPVLQKEYYWRGEWGMIDEDGNEKKAFTHVTLHCDEDKQPNYISAMFIDIAEQEKQKEETKHRRHQLNRLMNAAVVSEAASSLAHQLNQPLATISSTLQMWQVELKNQSMASGQGVRCRIMEEIDDLVEKTFAMGKLIHHVNSAVKRSEFVPEWCFLERIIAEARDNLSMSLNGIQVNVRLSEELRSKRVFVDSILLTQIFNNLMTNSQDALIEINRRDAEIHVCCKLQDDNLIIDFYDNGQGVPVDRADSVFEPFYSTKELGSGIGLAWVKSTLETMGGHITLQNPSDVITGAHFELQLPVALESNGELL